MNIIKKPSDVMGHQIETMLLNLRIFISNLVLRYEYQENISNITQLKYLFAKYHQNQLRSLPVKASQTARVLPL